MSDFDEFDEFDDEHDPPPGRPLDQGELRTPSRTLDPVDHVDHRHLGRDTTPDAATTQLAVLRRMPAARRLEVALNMSEEIAAVAHAGARWRARAAASH